MDASKTITAVFALLVTFGVAYMVVKNPSGTNAVLGAGATSVAGLTRVIEGKQ